VGLKSGITPEKFQQAIKDGTVEDCLNRVPVSAGDAIFVPAGTAHTIGPGLLLCEIQEYSDITYRVYDYNRAGADGKPRALHIQKALEVMRFGAQTGGRATPLPLASDVGERTLLVACRHFAVERWTFSSRRPAQTSHQRFELLIVIEGEGDVESRGVSAKYVPGEAWFLPAALGEYVIVPRYATTILRAFVPDFATLARELAARSDSAAALARTVFP